MLMPICISKFWEMALSGSKKKSKFSTTAPYLVFRNVNKLALRVFKYLKDSNAVCNVYWYNELTSTDFIWGQR